MSKESMEKIIEEVRNIPPLPAVVVKVIALTRDSNTSANDLNRVISLDPALTANLLKLCNSAYYGLPRVVSSITQAVMYLGFHTVRNLVLTSTMSDFLARDVSGYGYAKGGLWQHSVAVAVGAEQLCKRLRPGLQDVAFTAGLIHDIGKVVLSRFVADAWDDIRGYMEKNNVPFMEAERQILGFDHALLGAKIADTWNFPQELVNSIGYHHKPEDAKGRPLLSVIVHLADVAALQMGYGLGYDGLMYPLSEYAVRTANMSQKDMEELYATLEESMKNATSFLEISAN
ncbi:HDOD domain-containing protein [bacterium]|nr:HDOD domain-containing protein [bacterium]